MKIKNSYAIAIIMTSIIASWILANTVELPPSISLGALVFWFFPILVGIGSIVLYLICVWKFKKMELIFLIVSCLINLYFGFSLHINPPL